MVIAEGRSSEVFGPPAQSEAKIDAVRRVREIAW